MRIIEEEQLDFDDVLIQPKRSDINSRKDVSIYRTFEWNDVYGNKHELNCIPVMISNMGTVGTPKMAKIAALNGYMCALEKHTSLKDICDLFDELECLAEKEQQDKTYYTQRVCPSIGIKESTDNLKELSKRHHVTVVCIDVPNGYIPNLIKRIKEIRDIFPTSLIIAGNVVTPDITQDIIMAGANVVKCGIGNGCFRGDMKVLTENGLKKIQDIDIGDKVLTHTGSYEKVINKFEFSSHKKIIDINGIKCTPNHKFYVVKIEDIDKITDDNYQEFCIWIKAEDLDCKKYKLIKIK